MERLTERDEHGGIHVNQHDYIEAAKRLAAYEDTGLTPEEIMDGKMLTGWISVDEKLPGETEFYLVTRKMDRSDDLVVSVMWFNSEKKTWELFSSEAHKGIIAWMLLPETYKPERKYEDEQE